MASVTEAPPRAVQAELDALSSLLDDSIPSKQLDRNLLIASWNIRAFGGLTQSWSAGDGDSPKRDFHALRAIASVVSRFDVIAIQEAKSELTAMRALMSVLGEDWGMIMTDATKGTAGNAERFAFVFDRRRVNPSGLAAELVVPVEDAGVSTDAFNQQFARTPYAVSFRASGVEFILVTLHVLFGQRSAERIPELLAIANWLSDWAIWQPRLEQQSDRPRRLQHRSPRRPAACGIHFDGPGSTPGFERCTAHDLRERAGALL